MHILYIKAKMVSVRLSVRRRFRVLIDVVEPARTVGFGPDSRIRKTGFEKRDPGFEKTGPGIRKNGTRDSEKRAAR